jgi:membrane fusion protein, cation efflux system
MKKFPFSPLLAVVLTLSTPAIAFAHVGHGDEFQSKGGIQKVKVNADTDKQLGIEVKAIAPETGGGKSVLIPVTSLVDADGKQLVFVQYQNFYEPVPVKTGTTKGDLIEITEGLSVGEKLVTQGSLTLYAESRKTKPTSTSPAATTTAPAPTSTANAPATNDPANTKANAEGKAPNQSTESEFPIMKVGIIGGGALLVAGTTIAVLANRSNRKKKSVFSGKKGDF